ncbi:MAG: hypothetical protein R2854_03490 [Caldilineaceae bacterium]
MARRIFAGDLAATVGGSAIVAAGLHRLGARRPHRRPGRRPLQRHHPQRAGRHRPGADADPGAPHPLRTTVALSFPADRAFVTRFAHQPPTPSDLTELRCASARHLHICSFLAALETPDVARIARAGDDRLHGPGLG